MTQLNQLKKHNCLTFKRNVLENNVCNEQLCLPQYCLVILIFKTDSKKVTRLQKDHLGASLTIQLRVIVYSLPTDNRINKLPSFQMATSKQHLSLYWKEMKKHTADAAHQLSLKEPKKSDSNADAFATGER